MTVPTPALRLKAKREERYKFARDAARAMGVSPHTYAQHENGTRDIPREAAKRYAKFYRVSLDWLLTGKGSAGPAGEALLVGKIGAGAEIYRFDEGVVMEGVEAPDVGGTLAARIEGDSMLPFQDGWTVFYEAENQGIPERCVGRLCAVGIKDGPTLIKVLRRGSRKGRWNLESWNASLREDVQVEWASPVILVRPS